MTYDEYNKAVDALEAPGDLDIFEKIKWLNNKIKGLRELLTASDLRKVLQDQKRWDDKVLSSLQD